MHCFMWYYCYEGQCHEGELRLLGGGHVAISRWVIREGLTEGGTFEPKQIRQ